LDYITVSLTPGRHFYNLDKEKVERELMKINFRKNSTMHKFSTYSNDNCEIIKLREDGSIYYKVKIIEVDTKVVFNILWSIEKIVSRLNPIYDNLLNTDELFIYWPDSFDGKNLNLTNYLITTEKILDNKYSSIFKKKLCRCM
jgi:hypothetical protein